MKILVTGGSGFIGTNLIDGLLNHGHEILNVDVVRPKNADHDSFWIDCDVLDSQKLDKHFSSFKPAWVIHLAATTDADGKTLDHYCVNTQGTTNLLGIIKRNSYVERLILTSSQFVHYGESLPTGDEDYLPFTIYGESKVISEQLTRKAQLDCTWAIIRPTRVWGYWQPGRLEFYRMLYRGLYIHPGKKPVIRAFGYVGNVVHQIIKILESPRETVQGKVFYVGDKPINLLDWVEGFAKRINNKRVIYVPRFFIKGLAMIGDILCKIGVHFPISSYRYNSLVTSDNAPMKLTFDTFGCPPYTLDQAIDETVRLIKMYHPEFRGKTRLNEHP
jgi:nucleoside-diphosphate-sugar epimerase